MAQRRKRFGVLSEDSWALDFGAWFAGCSERGEIDGFAASYTYWCRISSESLIVGTAAAG